MKKDNPVIFSRDVVEFVTVAAEFCKLVEQAEETPRRTLIDTSVKLLPLLYLKANLLPPCELLGDEMPETYVTEETYEVVRLTLAQVLGADDSFMDVFVADMKYSDQPIAQTVSECLADVYQDVRDFIFVFRLGLSETMHDALALCQEHFRQYWGQRLLGALRALHAARYAEDDAFVDGDVDAEDAAEDSRFNALAPDGGREGSPRMSAR